MTGFEFAIGLAAATLAGVLPMGIARWLQRSGIKIPGTARREILARRAVAIESTALVLARLLTEARELGSKTKASKAASGRFMATWREFGRKADAAGIYIDDDTRSKLESWRNAVEVTDSTAEITDYIESEADELIAILHEALKEALV